MPTTLTLKNIPDEVYSQLKATAELHHRSINSEVIHCLESILLPRRITPEDRLRRADELRAAVGGRTFSPRQIAKSIKAGRR